jgi:plasmid stabilization system protein ParE
MPRLLVSGRAQRGLISIGEYIARDNVDAAMRFYAAAEAAFDLLAHLPGAGPKVDPPIHAQPDMRFWPIAATVTIWCCTGRSRTVSRFFGSFMAHATSATRSRMADGKR